MPVQFLKCSLSSRWHQEETASLNPEKIPAVLRIGFVLLFKTGHQPQLFLHPLTIIITSSLSRIWPGRERGHRRVLTLSRPGFLELLWWGESIGTPFENHVPLLLILSCLVFLKACPKLDHMTHFSFHGNRFSVLRWLKVIFYTKCANQRHCTNGIIFSIWWKCKY